MTATDNLTPAQTRALTALYRANVEARNLQAFFAASDLHTEDGPVSGAALRALVAKRLVRVRKSTTADYVYDFAPAYQITTKGAWEFRLLLGN